MIVGIDPGLYGAIAFLDGNGVDVLDMPIFKDPRGNNIINVHALGTYLIPRGEGRQVAILEKVGPQPRDGKSSAFKLGRRIGAIEAFIAGHGYEIHEVTPGVWKKHFRLNSDKNLSRSLACQRFPGQAPLFARVKDDGRAEASLIALYGAEKLVLTGAI